jgi:hypothetical protein
VSNDEEANVPLLNTRKHEVVLACLLPVLVFVVCRALASSWYSVDLSGVPDEGQVPTGLLPWFLYEYRIGGDIWSDAVRMRTWGVACAGYFAPALIATLAPRRTPTRLGALVVVIGLLVWAILAIPRPPAPPTSLTYFTASNVGMARLWIAGLGLLGSLVGLLARVAAAGVQLATRSPRSDDN